MKLTTKANSPQIDHYVNVLLVENIALSGGLLTGL